MSFIIPLSGPGISNSDKGVANGVASLDSNALVPINNIPPASLERLIIVANQTARYALTTATVQNGDTVKQTDTSELYFVIDQTNLGNSAGYTVYTAATASAVAVTGITGVATASLIGRTTGGTGAAEVLSVSSVKTLLNYTTADIAASTDKNYVTDAQQTVIQNTSGTNTGDNATNSQYSGLAASKQDTLVSATNIKTINSTSLLGSGDISTTQDLSGLAVKANNLSDLTSASTARTNLGLGTLATQSGTFSGTSSGTNTGDQTNISGNAATVTTNANLTGDITSSGNATTIGSGKVTSSMIAASTIDLTAKVTGVLPAANGGVTDTGAWVSFVPTITAGSGTFTTTSSQMYYMRVGKGCWLYGSITITTVGTGSGSTNFTLPFTASRSVPTPLFIVQVPGLAMQSAYLIGSTTVCSVTTTPTATTYKISGFYEMN